MDKRLFNTLQNIIRMRKPQSRSNDRLSAFCEEQGIGSPKGQYIQFSYQDFDRIEEWLKHTVNAKPLLAEVGQDYIETAAHFSEEKWAKSGVFSSHLNVARTSCLPISLTDGNSMMTPEGVSINLPPERLLLDSPVVVVENGSLLTHWPMLVQTLPAECQDAIIIYRGHGKNQSALERVLKESTLPVYGYFDFDLAGMIMADSWHQKVGAKPLLPAQYEQIASRVKAGEVRNKPKSFDKQLVRFGKTVALKNATLNAAYSYLVKHRLAVTQEHLLVVAHSIEVI